MWETIDHHRYLTYPVTWGANGSAFYRSMQGVASRADADADTDTDATRHTHRTCSDVSSAPRWWNTLHSRSYLSLYDPLQSTTHRAIAISSAMLAVLAGIPLPIIGYLLGQVINDFPPDDHALRAKLLQLLGVATGYFLITAAHTTGFGLTAEHVSMRLRMKVLHCLLHVDQAYLDTHNVDVNGLLTEKMDTVKTGCSEKVGILIQSGSYFVAALIVGFVLDARLTGILVASVVPAIFLCFIVFSPAVSRYSHRVAGQESQANGIVESALGAVRTVQAFDMAAELCRRHSVHLEASTRLSVRKSSLAAMQAASIYFLSFAANSLAFYIGSRFASGGNAGTVYAVVFLILDASAIVGQFAPFLEILARAASAKAIVQRLLDYHKQSSATQTRHPPDKKTPDLRGCDINFQAVLFHYPARPTVPVLQGVTLRLQASKFTAVVGTSGGGKSTLVALLMGIYDYSGTINIGTDDLKSINMNHLRSQVSLLDQDSSLFTGSILENVCHGLVGQNLPDQEKTQRCEDALSMANVNFLQHLPQGIHTVVGNKIQLSGGQRQRICLARALINRPAILILDEPTSALDAGSEAAVMDAVKKIVAGGTTVFMVAHRLSTTLDADYVAVMSNGKVVEQGAPRDLSVKGTVFRGLLDAQNTEFTPEAQSEYMQSLEKFSETRSLRLELTSISQSANGSQGLHGEPSASTYTLCHLARRILKVAKPERWIAILALTASTFSGCIMLGHAFVFGNLVTILNGGTSSPSYHDKANFFCLIFFLLSLLTLVSWSISGSGFGYIAAHLTGRVQANMFNVLLNLDIQWFSQSGHSVHELMSRFTKDPGDFSALGGVALGSIFTMLASIVGGIILAHVIAWEIAVVLLAAVPVMLAAGYGRLRVVNAAEARQREAYTEPTSLAAESCRNRRTVTALCLQDHFLVEYERSLQKPYRQIRKFVCCSNVLFAICLAIPYFVYALAYWWGSRQVRDGKNTTTDFFIALPALLVSAQSAGYFFSLSPEIARAKAAARSIFSIMDARPCIMQPDDQPGKFSEVSSLTKSSLEQSHVPDEKTTVKGTPILEFQNVTLWYCNSSSPSLRNVSFTVPRGKTIALVGPSGAGKSSVIALIERFYDPTHGTVLVNGHDIRNLDVRTLRSHMGLVSQDPNLFTGSISDNVKLGAPTAGSVSDADVQAACRKCGLHDFITSLPEGYNTECGSSSSSHLSGGQKQRLAIARALVRNPEVLLLDEPTSALDAHSEAHVQAALAEASKDRTTIIVAHRLASIQRVDRIFVFDQGRLIAEGTHAELVRQGGLYASMAKAQSLV